MAKGFTDSNGKFRPTGNNGTSSRQKTVSPDGSRIKTTKHKVWKFDKAPDEVKEKIIEKVRQNRYEFNDDFFAQGDWLLDSDVFNWSDKLYYEVGSNRGTDYLQFTDLEVKDDNKFRKLLGLDKKLWDKFDYSIYNPPRSFGYEYNTTIEFGVEETDLSSFEKLELERAKEKFDDMIHEALSNLTKSYEDQFSDETIAEDAGADGFDYDEDGEIV